MRKQFLSSLLPTLVLSLALMISISLVGCEANVPGSGQSIPDAMRDNQSNESTGNKENSPREPANIAAPVAPSESNDEMNSKNSADPSVPRDEKGIPGAPTAQLRHDDATSVGGPIDLNEFPYSKREDFKNVMNARLGDMERSLETLKSVNPSKTQTKGEQTQVVKRVEAEKARVSGQLAKIENVTEQRWETFKAKFRDDVVKLEQDIKGAATARR